MSAVLSCNSLVDEAHRIQTVYNEKYTPLPLVVSTDPADNTIAPYNQKTITLVFSTAIDPTTIATQSAFGNCSGSFQISYDNFNHCLGGTLDTSQNPTIVFTPTYFPKTLQLKIQITNDVQSAVGLPAQPYTMPNGFRLGGPCGNSNCFFSYSTPLMTATGATSRLFPILGGANSGDYLAYTSGSSQTTLIDPVAGTSAPGPNFAPCAAPGIGTYDFYVNSGTLSGMQLIVMGNGSTNTCIFNHSTNAFTNIFAPTLPIGSSTGGVPIAITTGPSTGDTLLIAGNVTTNVMQFKAATGSITNITGTSPLPATATLGTHAVQASALSMGQAAVFLGNGANNGLTLDTTAANPTFTSCWPLFGTFGDGAVAFEVYTGAKAGTIIALMGGGSLLGNYLGESVCAMAVQNPAMFASVGPGVGALLLRRANTVTQDSPILLLANNTFSVTQYDSSTGDFLGANPPPSTGVVGMGSAKIFMGATASGAFFIVNGASSASTSVFKHDTFRFHGSRLPTDIPKGAGSHAFYVSSGTNAGNTIVVSGNSSKQTALFVPVYFDMQGGPQLQAAATTNSFAIPLTAGAHAGKVLEAALSGNAVNAYTPATGKFVDSASLVPALPAFPAFGTGATAFPVQQVVSDSRIVIVAGGGVANALLWDQTISPMTLLPIGCAPNNAVLNASYTKPSTGVARQLIYCGGSSLAWFDHSAVTFAGLLALTAPANPTLKAFAIASGPNAGKVMVMHGSPATTTSIVDNETNAVSAGPSSAAACAPNTGAQIVAITSGANAGSELIIVGGGSTVTCLYNPLLGPLGTFSVNAAVSSTASPGYQINTGSVAFATNGGLYAGSTIVLTGAGSNVWSAYVP